jgi:hypothetical protein
MKRINGKIPLVTTLATGCVAMALLWPQWRDELRAQEYPVQENINQQQGAIYTSGRYCCMTEMTCTGQGTNRVCTGMNCTLIENDTQAQLCGGEVRTCKGEGYSPTKGTVKDCTPN